MQGHQGRNQGGFCGPDQRGHHPDIPFPARQVEAAHIDPGSYQGAAGYISEGLEGCYVQIIDDAPVAVLLPASVVLQVVETPPELKGGTATKRPKPARLNTGIEIQVPEYISNGEKIWVSTVTGEFGGRA